MKKTIKLKRPPQKIKKLGSTVLVNLKAIHLRLRRFLEFEYSWFCVFIISHAHFRVNLHTIVTWIPGNSLLETSGYIWNLSDCNGIRTYNHFVRKRAINSWVLVYKLSGTGFESRSVFLFVLHDTDWQLWLIWIFHTHKIDL